MTTVRRASNRAYVAREEFIPNPLNEAKKLAEKVINEARSEALRIKDLAKNEALQIVEAAKAEAIRIKDEALELTEGIGNRLKSVMGDLMSKILGPVWDWILSAWSWFKWVLTMVCCVCLCSSSWACGCIPGLIALLSN